jgi:hypothetical protein
VHDFGSILAFTEYNFSMPFVDEADKGYADYNAPDWSADRKTVVPLSDFFQLSQPRSFVSISTPHAYTCFQDFSRCTGATYVPADPDDDNDSD